MHSFKVKSYSGNYSVDFIYDFKQELQKELKDHDTIIIDEKIVELYPNSLKDLNQSIKIISIVASEKNKSYEGLKNIIQTLIQNEFKKNHRLIAIGGGIIQDIASFTASIMYRGVKWIYFPTTLLAQGDSCIGSKTSINFGKYKNQNGGFYPPDKIFIDPNFHKTLGFHDLQSGLGEMSHYFVIAGKKDFDNFKSNYSQSFTDLNILSGIIYNSLMIKKDYVEIDEFDVKERQIFNYGHSFGHAIESLTNYKIPHGIAVSFGMDMANYVSLKRKFLRESIRNEIRELLCKIWGGYSISNLNHIEFIDALKKDKKNVGDELRLILCKGYGEVFKAPQKIDELFEGWIYNYFEYESK